ncbi:MAG: hypothetical protein GXO71_00570 [Caldiserica bacterium]|nr:hypothetical protein [Caldisericota bacterium]
MDDIESKIKGEFSLSTNYSLLSTEIVAREELITIFWLVGAGYKMTTCHTCGSRPARLPPDVTSRREELPGRKF